MKTRQEARGERQEVALRKAKNSMRLPAVPCIASNVLRPAGRRLTLSPHASYLSPGEAQ